MQNSLMKEAIEYGHQRCRDATKQKLYKKLMSCRLRWSKENEITVEDAEKLIFDSIGEQCIYCKEVINANNISLDHETPLHRGGNRKLKNLYIVCLRCNKRKGIMNFMEYISLLTHLDGYDDEVRGYVLRKLASKDMWGVDKKSKKE